MKEREIHPLVPSDDDRTESINVGDAFRPDFGSPQDFVRPSGGSSPLARLLDALPTPALILDSTCRVAFTNQACSKLGIQGDPSNGSPFYTIFRRSTDGDHAQKMALKVLQDRRPFVHEGMLEIGASRLWCRMHMRSLKTGTAGSVLVLLEDLTAERKQFVLTRKKSQELLKLHDELEERVQERTAELAQANESLRAEIAERRKAELRLRSSEKKYKNLAELLPQIVYEIDTNGVFTFVNHSGLEALGYSTEDLRRGLKATNVFSQADRQQFASALKAVLQGGKTNAQQYTALRKDGTTFPVMAYSSAISRDKRILGVRGVCVDITERERAGHALRETEQQYRLLTECSLTGICIVQDDAAVYVNDRYCDITGYSREEMIGMSPWRLVHPADVYKIGKEKIKDLASTHHITPCEFRFIGKTGETRWVEAIATTINHQGIPARLLNIADITERKQAEESLRTTLVQLESRDMATTEELLKTTGMLNREIFERIRVEDALVESENRYRTLVETAKDIIWTVDLNLRFTYVSPAVKRLLGYAPEEIMNRDPLEIVTQGSRERMRQAFQQELLQAGEESGETFSSRSAEIEQYHKDGSTRWMEVTLTWLRGPDNSPSGLLGISRDITRRREADAVLQNAVATAAHLRDEAEAANRAKGDFLASMSHELRTPLNAIIGFSEILEDQTFGQLNDKQSRYVHHVVTSGRHLLQLINDILDLAKIESGKMELQISRVNLRKLLESSMIMIKEKALRHHLRLTLTVSDELVSHTISADEMKLKQIVFNLLSNAAKFTPDGGAITVIASKDRGNVLVKVQDTGIGISREDRERIFGAFEQVDSSYSRSQQGTGLGLALTRQLVELHGGKIWAESRGEGLGSVFVFTIPANGGIPPDC